MEKMKNEIDVQCMCLQFVSVYLLAYNLLHRLSYVYVPSCFGAHKLRKKMWCKQKPRLGNMIVGAILFNMYGDYVLSSNIFPLYCIALFAFIVLKMFILSTTHSSLTDAGTNITTHTPSLAHHSQVHWRHND